MLASVTMCNDDIRNYNSKISDLGYLTHITHRLHKRGLYSELGGETESLLTPDVDKLSHNGTSNAQASVYLWVGVAVGVYIRAQVCKPGYCPLYCCYRHSDQKLKFLKFKMAAAAILKIAFWP